MICNHCGIQMKHLNMGYGFSGTDTYQTYDYLECDSCKAIAVEVYHTEFVTAAKDELPKVEINLVYNK